MILYFAPGSGVGHLNRALAVCLELRELGAQAQIVTGSPFAEGIARAARFPIVNIADDLWARGAREYLERVRPKLAVIDAFPAGLRGEWIEPVSVPLVYVARRLRLENYFDPSCWPEFLLTIEAEPLAHAVRGPVLRLQGPIRLAPGAVPVPMPAELEKMLGGGRTALIIHSGPPAEILTLTRMAGSQSTVLISPWHVPGMRRFDYYPACNVVASAPRVITGAGYNAMADMLFLRDRHIAIPFDRKYDDQAARLDAGWMPKTDGTGHAALAIASAANS
jgi:hypothetical protein